MILRVDGICALPRPAPTVLRSESGKTSDGGAPTRNVYDHVGASLLWARAGLRVEWTNGDANPKRLRPPFVLSDRELG